MKLGRLNVLIKHSQLGFERKKALNYHCVLNVSKNQISFPLACLHFCIFNKLGKTKCSGIANFFGVDFFFLSKTAKFQRYSPNHE